MLATWVSWSLKVPGGLQHLFPARFPKCWWRLHCPTAGLRLHLQPGGLSEQGGREQRTSLLIKISWGYELNWLFSPQQTLTDNKARVFHGYWLGNKGHLQMDEQQTSQTWLTESREQTEITCKEALSPVQAGSVGCWWSLYSARDGGSEEKWRHVKIISTVLLYFLYPSEHYTDFSTSLLWVM